MKKPTKIILIICLILLVCAALFVRLILLPVGDNISLFGRMTVRTPGSLLEPWMLPRADQSDIGQTVTLSFPQLLKDSQYDDQDPLNPDAPEVMHIAYLYNGEKKTGALAVITETEHNSSLACLTIYEPEWTGGEGLFSNLTEEFQAKVIHRANIDWMEGISYFGAAVYGDLKEDPTLAIDPSNYEESPQKEFQCFYGRFYYGEEEIGQPLTEDITAAFLTYDLSTRTPQNDVFLRIAERFELEAYLGISDLSN